MASSPVKSKHYKGNFITCYTYTTDQMFAIKIHVVHSGFHYFT